MASSYMQKFPVPEGFPEILNDLIKNILREQPADIIEHSHNYFKNKLEDKDEPTAENKNYYGNQIIKQKKEEKAKVIPKPSPEKEEIKESPEKKEPSVLSEQKSHTTNQTQKEVANEFVDTLIGDTIDLFDCKDKTKSESVGITSHPTQKEVANEFVDDLVDDALEIYNCQMTKDKDGRPKTSGDLRQQSANSRQSQPQHKIEEAENEDSKVVHEVVNK